MQSGKRSDLGSISVRSETLVRFFNPRTDIWQQHFRVNSTGEVEPISEIGEVTIIIFRFNHLERVTERKGLLEIGSFMAVRENLD